VVWIAGPPGSGKTTLAATWLEKRKRPGIWYQLDGGDSEPATFFHYLRQAANETGARRKAPLPLLTPEYLADVPGFARRWFRELFSRLAPGAVLALDNYQEVSADSALHRTLASASREIPEGAQLLVMSWADPPAEFTALLAGERLARIEPEALKLDVDEASGIIGGRDALTPEQIRALHTQCGGWAAGFTLMRERVRRTGLVGGLDQRGTMQEVFDYFMAQVLQDAPLKSRDTLLKTAFLPRFTESMAREVSGDATAGELLDRLHRRHLFVDRRYGAEVAYEYHMLFRAFLLDRARIEYAPAAVVEIAKRAAGALEHAGLSEDAVRLLVDVGDGAGAAQLVEKLAQGLVASGRGAALEAWIEKLPEAERDGRPWLSYWLGAGITGAALHEARSAFERAYRGFERDADRLGQAMALVGVLNTHYLDVSSRSAMEPWLGLLESVLRDEPEFPSADVAAWVYGTLVGLMLWYVPWHPMYPTCVERLDALTRGVLPPDVKVTAASHLVEHYSLAGFVRKAEGVVSEVEPLLRGPAVSPLTRASWGLRSCRLDYALGDLDGVRRKVNETLAISLENGFRFLNIMIYGLQADVALSADDLGAVPAIVEHLREMYPPGRPQSRVLLCLAKLAIARGDLEEAQRQCEKACTMIGDHGLALARVAYHVDLASVLLERGDWQGARAAIDAVRRLCPPDLLPFQAFRTAAIAALVDAASPRPAGWRKDLEEWLRRIRELGVEAVVTTNPLLAKQLSRVALSEGIETAYVRAWIRKVRLRPSSPDVPNWPWAVRVRTLGPFGVDLDDAPLTFAGKVPRKPLQLLQAMVAFGGREVPSETLANALWPDSEADAADAALRMAVSRLRKLLGQADAVIQHESKLSLRDSVCWVDVWSFERLVRQIEADARPAHAARLLEVYRGALLQSEPERPWILGLRQRLRRRFVAAARRVAEAMVRDGAYEEAIAFCRDARDRDPAAETEALHREMARAAEAKSQGLLRG
jgi:LuxR family transcriptional regulator, maltose regulon positive regulatory protein